jgi:hypothetical protein
MQTPQADAHCKALAVEEHTPAVVLPLPDQRIRAPPLPG